LTLIDDSWYERPTGTPERIASGGIIVRLSCGETFVAFTREGDMPEFVLPKGGVEAGESLLAAAQREIEEETGLSRITLIRKLDVVERLTFDKSRWSVVHFFLFQTNQVDATPTETANHRHMSWFPIDALPRMLWPEQRDLIQANRDAIVRDATAAASSD
jgi:ADP-ribose pyrophosphatase YjhB (NUDIX family)